MRVYSQLGFEAESLCTQVGYGAAYTGHGRGQAQLRVVPVLPCRLLHNAVVLNLQQRQANKCVSYVCAPNEVP